MKLFALASFSLLSVATVASAADTFDASPQVSHVREKPKASAPSGLSIPAKARRVRVNVGEIVEVYRSPKGAAPEMALYLPPEGTRIAQIVREQTRDGVTYFVKGHARGSTVAGAVQRAWLDRAGFRPNNAADEARVQAAVKRSPVYIEVR